MKELINPKEAPVPHGPYNKAVKSNGLIFVGGQLPEDLKTGELIKDNIREQTKKSLENIKAILEAAESSIDKILMTTVYLKSVENQKRVNEVYREFFKKNFPSRATIEVSRLPKDALIEISAIAEE